MSGLLLAASALGCAGDDETAAAQVGYDSENDIRVTYNGDLSLMGSYHELFDRSADTPCVKYTDGERHARVSEPSRHLAIEMVTEKEDLARKLGIDLNLKARYATISGNAAGSD